MKKLSKLLLKCNELIIFFVLCIVTIAVLGIGLLFDLLQTMPYIIIAYVTVELVALVMGFLENKEYFKEEKNNWYICFLGKAFILFNLCILVNLFFAIFFNEIFESIIGKIVMIVISMVLTEVISSFIKKIIKKKLQ